MIAGVGDELDGKLEHEAVGVLLGQLVEELSPCGVLDHLLQPGWGLGMRQWTEVNQRVPIWRY